MNATIKNSSDINEFAKWIDENLEVELSINIETKKLDIQNGIYRNCLNISLVFLLVGILINAAEELRSTTESVTTITFKYQFDFQQTFTRAFTRRFGIAPIAYRKLAKEEVRWNS